MIKLEEFVLLMKKYTDFLETVAVNEKEKLEALLSDDITKIEQCIAVAQSTEKRILAYEKKRSDFLAEQGLEKTTLAQIIEMQPEQENKELVKILNRINAATETIKYYNQKSVDYVKARMYMTDKQQTEYTQDKKKAPKDDGPSLFTKKI